MDTKFKRFINLAQLFQIIFILAFSALVILLHLVSSIFVISATKMVITYILYPPPILYLSQKYFNVRRFGVFYKLFLLMITQQEAPKLRARVYCEWALILNCVFFLFEIVVLILWYQEWKFAAILILYRFSFNWDVEGYLKTIKFLADPPPGYKQ